MRVLQVNAETTMFTSIAPIPGVGALPINAFLIKGAQPMLIDAGIYPERDEFMAAVRSLVDLADLKWIWITHADRDHTGSLPMLLNDAPNATVVAHYITVGIMGAGSEPIPVERAHLVRDGSVLDIGDRRLVAVRPPTFDNPGTVGLFDPSQRLLLSSDCLGGALPTPEDALADDVGAVSEDDLRAGQLLWGSVDAPWVHGVDETKFGEHLKRFVSDQPQTILSTHLPPIRSDVERHMKTLSMLPSSEPFVAPDQAAMEAMMAQLAH